MSLRHEITISCDGCGAVFVSEGTRLTSEAELRAETAGWSLPDSGHDLCPACAALEEPS